MATDKPIYRIARWTETFETADSRKHRRLSWVSVPIGFSSNGFSALIEEFGDDAPSIYGTWIVLVQIAAECTVRGILATSRGVGLTPGRLSLKSHFPSTAFERLVEWASSEDVGWLEVMSKEEFDRLLTGQQSIDDRSSIELPDQTRPDPTLPNQTQRHTTRQDQTPAVCPSVVGRELDLSKVDPDEAKRQAIKLQKAYRSLSAELVWQVAWIGLALDPGFVGDLIVNMRGKSIHSPTKYVKGAIRNACIERDLDWKSCLHKVPDLPSKPEQAK